MKNISLLFCIFIATLQAYSDFYKGWKYINNDDGTVTVCGYDKNAKGMIIPDELDGKTVVSIGDSAFKDYQQLRYVRIPETVSNIGPSAFLRCFRLKSILIPSSVTAIQKRAFWNCTTAKLIILSSSLTTIGDRAFANSMYFKTITIPASVKRIGENVFSDCQALTSIDVERMNSNYSSQDGVLFNKDKSVLIEYPLGKTDVSYTLPESVTHIAYRAFANSDKLRKINLSISIENIDAGAFSGCTNLNSIELFEGLKKIKVSTFSQTALRIIEIPSSVISISSFAFSECKKLESINVSEENPNYLSEDGVLFNKDMTTLIKYPPAKYADPYIFPITVTKVKNGAFVNCKQLLSIVISPKIAKIGSTMFADCPNLRSTYVNEMNMDFFTEDNILFNKDKTTLIKYAESKTEEFYIIPESVTKIAKQAFFKCTNLKFIELPTSLTDIGPFAFRECSNLNSIIIPEGVNEITNQAFSFCSSLKSVTIPTTVTIISDGAFCFCKKLQSITIPRNVTTIKQSAFLACYSLKSLIIPSSVTSIGKDAFNGCRKLKRVLFLGDSPNSLGERIFNISKPKVTVYYITGAKVFFKEIWDDYNMAEIPSEDYFKEMNL